METTQYYLNNGESSLVCDIPEEKETQYFQIENNLSELNTSQKKKLARNNLGITTIITDLQNKINEKSKYFELYDDGDLKDFIDKADVYVYQKTPVQFISYIIEGDEIGLVFKIQNGNNIQYVRYESESAAEPDTLDKLNIYTEDTLPDEYKKAFGQYSTATTQNAGLMSKEDKTLLNSLAINVQSIEIIPYLKSEDSMPLANFYLYNDIPISNWRIIDGNEGAYTILFCIDNNETVRHYIYFEGENIEEDGFNYVDEYDEESVPSWIKEAFGIYNEEASTTSAGLMSASDKTKLNSLDPYEDYGFEILAGNTFTIEPRQNLLFDNQKLYIILEEISGQKTSGTMTGLIKVNIIDHNTVIGSTELFTSSYDVHSTDGVALSTLLNGNAMIYGASIELLADGHYVNGMCFIR